MIRKLILYIIALVLSMPSLMALENNIDSLYKEGKYEEIVNNYNTSFDKDMGSSDYFVLAQCYYHIGDIGLSILNYERALMLDPNNNAIINNLEIARLASVDKQNLTATGFSKFVDNICYYFSPKVLMVLAILMFACAVALFIMFRLAATYKKRKISFILSIVSIFLCLLFNAMLMHSSYYLNDSSDYAIVTDRKVEMNTDSSKEQVKELHSGAKVKIITMGDNISMVELPDGTKGNVITSAITPISLSK